MEDFFILIMQIIAGIVCGYGLLNYIISLFDSPTTPTSTSTTLKSKESNSIKKYNNIYFDNPIYVDKIDYIVRELSKNGDLGDYWKYDLKRSDRYKNEMIFTILPRKSNVYVLSYDPKLDSFQVRFYYKGEEICEEMLINNFSKTSIINVTESVNRFKTEIATEIGYLVYGDNMY